MRMIMQICVAMVVFAHASNTAVSYKVSPLKAVPHVDLNRYLDKWYEIASFPHWFQKG
jgi:apolipoprotein D and lipocalin family protein